MAIEAPPFHRSTERRGEQRSGGERKGKEKKGKERKGREGKGRRDVAPAEAQVKASSSSSSSNAAAMVTMRDVGYLLVPVLILARSSLQGDLKSGKEADGAGNFMEDEQWLSTISQYSRKIKHWNRFRDVSARAAGSCRTRGKPLVAHFH
ncbi:hypothetical protein Z043_105575 [Scleropages formosus]|uniref:Uncharacterized protein n=1 Tax=Scleropages formosus TaxID=113540 RepID=A0A0P7ULE1_SCLFO|nr:hypothetical protein Z043_105575 [Scleropages formosus]